jgi:cytoskeleton protein RodZ
MRAADSMTETKPTDFHNSSAAGASASGSAGAMIRAARQQQGMHIASLAAAMKVPQAKLEALEAGRYSDLPDLTFVRVLALSVCRTLKIDPAPVLAQLPGVELDALGSVDGGLNMPFRDRPGRVVPADLAPWRHPVLWLAALLLIAAAAFVLLPSLPLPQLAGGGAADATPAPVMPPGSEATSDPALPAEAASAAAPEVTAPAPSAMASAAAGPAPVPPALPTAASGPAEALVVRAAQATWLQVTDGSGRTLIARMVPAGETVTFDAAPPLRLRIGNARGTELSYRGKPVDLNPRDNVANLTLP